MLWLRWGLVLLVLLGVGWAQKQANLPTNGEAALISYTDASGMRQQQWSNAVVVVVPLVYQAQRQRPTHKGVGTKAVLLVL